MKYVLALQLFVASLHLSLGYHLGFFVPLKFRDTSNWGAYDRNGNSYPHALTVAVDHVNKDPDILPGHNLTYDWTDSTRPDDGLRAMYQKYILPPNGSKPVDVFIGPAYHCHAPAKVAEAFNIPMISYFCVEGGNFTKQEYPLLVRTYQNTDSQAAGALLTLLRKQQWKRVAIIYENTSYWRGVKDSIMDRGLDVVAQEPLPVNSAFTTYGTTYRGPGSENVERNRSLKQTRTALTRMAEKKQVKIFLVLTSFRVLLDVMAEAHSLQLTGTNTPHRVFIGFQLETGKTRPDCKKSDMFENKNINATENASRIKLVKQAARSLLIIAVGKPSNRTRYEAFRDEVIYRTRFVPPFNDTTVYFMDEKYECITEIAPALYDAVYEYARALHRLHERNANISARSIVDEFRKQSYTGMSGFTSVFRQKDGSLQVHLSLLHLDDAFAAKAMKIGSFKYHETKPLELSFSNDGKIKWPWGTKRPTDQMTCEDDGYDCPDDDIDNTVRHYVVPVVLSVVFSLIFGALCVLFMRQWRRERDLKRSIWEIDINDIVFDRKVSTESKFSDDSGVRSLHDLEVDSLLSGNSQCFDDNFITEADVYSMKSYVAVKSLTGKLKGDRVFVKVLPKIVEITRPIQKELRMLRHIRHENLNPFLGLGSETSHLWIVMQLGCKGTLEEVLANPDINLNHSFIMSLVYDIAKGMMFLQNSDIKSHGNLKSSNCVIDNRWVLKITDYGIREIRSRQATYTVPQAEEKKFRDLLWKAPELLRQTDPPLRGTQKGDVYSFAIILEELHTLKSPYSNSGIPARKIVDRIVDGEMPPYRPIVTETIDNAECLLGLMKSCWRESPDKRPSFVEIKYDVECAMTKCGLKTDICDNMITLLENYSSDLENVVSERTRQLREEKHKTEALLDRMLPRSVAEQLKRGEAVQAESFSSVTIYFSDIVQFTALCAESTPMQVVGLLNDLYLLFDDIIMDYNVYKVETIGDAYMVVSGLPMRNGKLHASEISCMALEILHNVRSFRVKHRPEHKLQVRIGIHTGPVVAGVVGMTMPRYCLFGDTVNTASRMESNGEALRIHVSESTSEVLGELGGFYLQQRPGQVYLKGKGNCTTFWLEGAANDVPRCPRQVRKKALKPLFQNSDARKMSAPFRSRKRTQISIPRASVA